jgi:hypothetical protein
LYSLSSENDSSPDHQSHNNGRARAASAAPIAITRATGDDISIVNDHDIHDPDSHHSHAHHVIPTNDDDEPIISVGEWVRAVARMLINRHMLLLSGMFVWTGLELAFWNGEFPQFLAKDVIGITYQSYHQNHTSIHHLL